MADSIQITASGIQRVLKKYDYRQAIAEYIWNGFDAKAKIVHLNYESNGIGFITKLEISDNGYGIPRSRLDEKFKPFFDSEKAIEIESPKNTSAIHGKNGVGRLTFFKFCADAKWETVYEEKGKKYGFSIRINVQSLNKYNSPDSSHKEIESDNTDAGTIVKFSNIFPDITIAKLEQDLWAFLCLEFGWYLELNKVNGHQLFINGQLLDYESYIAEEETAIFVDEEVEVKFNIKFILWRERINKEYSKFYYMGADYKERFKEYTLLNNKGDRFYHSVYVQSDYFNHFNFKSSSESSQITLTGSRNDGVFKRLHKKLSDYIKSKRKPFLRQYTDRLINEYESEGVFPKFGNNKWDIIKKEELENVVRGLYEVQPKIFLDLNVEQKKTFVRLLNLVLDSDERDKLFNILEEVVDLSSEEMEQMSEILKVTRLNKINQTIRLIEDRYKTINLLKILVFDENIQANEVDHLQKMIESHYWIFGEQYHLVTAAEQKFEEALRRYTYLLRGEKNHKKINHEDKNREMDIFMCRQDILTNEIKNIVVELKHPKLKLGEKELTQVKAYMNVIISEPEFNGNNMNWEFYLVGSGFNKKLEIENAITNAMQHGEKSLVFKVPRYKIYAKTWNEVFNDFEMRHKFLNDKLQLERNQLQPSIKSANPIVHFARGNTAAMSQNDSSEPVDDLPY